MPPNLIKHTLYEVVLPVVDEADQTFVVENLEGVLSKLLKGNLVCSKQCFACNLKTSTSLKESCKVVNERVQSAQVTWIQKAMSLKSYHILAKLVSGTQADGDSIHLSFNFDLVQDRFWSRRDIDRHMGGVLTLLICINNALQAIILDWKTSPSP